VAFAELSHRLYEYISLFHVGTFHKDESKSFNLGQKKFRGKQKIYLEKLNTLNLKIHLFSFGGEVYILINS